MNFPYFADEKLEVQGGEPGKETAEHRAKVHGCNLLLSFISCGTVRKLLNLSMLQFPRQENMGDNKYQPTTYGSCVD